MTATVEKQKKTSRVKKGEDVGSLAAHWGRRDDVPLELRQRLYPAVFEAFANEDFNNVGIREISNLSGVSSATIYKYFDSKEVLLTTVYGEVFPYYAGEMSKCVSVDCAADVNLRALYARLFGLYDSNPSLPTVFFITVPSKLWMDSGGWKATEVVPIFEMVLAAGQRRGELDPKLTVSGLMGLFYMHMQREVEIWYLGGKSWRLDGRVDAFFHFFWRSVCAPQEMKSAARKSRTVSSKK
ncbi:TetR/AcrR family transcriptional regulator [Acidovorax sp.]|uniref:TetR/AcrR family transcriptional regulator n=1 Tax=Acidovorax sp. TaxID=1872122 RepID=UPI002FB296D6